MKAVSRKSHFALWLTRYRKHYTAVKHMKNEKSDPAKTRVVGGGEGWRSPQPLLQELEEMLEGLPLRRWLNRGSLCCLSGQRCLHSDSHLGDMRRWCIRKGGRKLALGSDFFLFPPLEQLSTIGPFWNMKVARSETFKDLPSSCNDKTVTLLMVCCVVNVDL